MNKYTFAAQHGFASVFGWIRMFFAQPGFAIKIFRLRWKYFAKRTFDPGCITPDGFILETPDMLIAYWSMFVERELHDSEWVAALKSGSRPLVIDVGANAGMFSHLAFTINPEAEIVAFEPLPMMIDRINAMQKRNAMNLRCIPKAVGRSVGEAVLESPHGYDGTSRISTSAAVADTRTFRVEITTLDKELAGKPVALMKIDVEGFEDEVIAGAKETLSLTKFLIIEAHDAARRDRLTELLGKGWRREKLGSSDYLFIRI